MSDNAGYQSRDGHSARRCPTPAGRTKAIRCSYIGTCQGRISTKSSDATDGSGVLADDFVHCYELNTGAYRLRDQYPVEGVFVKHGGVGERGNMITDMGISIYPLSSRPRRRRRGSI